MHASPGPLAVATALPGAPPIVAALGDQQASLIGQGALDTAVAKLTLGTSAIADAYIGTDTPALLDRATHGSYPVVAHSVGGVLHWAREAVILTAGTCIDWLVDDLALLANPAESESVAASVTDTDGAWFVPAMLGLGTPHWDYGARGTLLGLTRGTTRAHVVRAVLRGIAHRSADLLDAMHRDGAARRRLRRRCRPGCVADARIHGALRNRARVARTDDLRCTPSRRTLTMARSGVPRAGLDPGTLGARLLTTTLVAVSPWHFPPAPSPRPTPARRLPTSPSLRPPCSPSEP